MLNCFIDFILLLRNLWLLVCEALIFILFACQAPYGAWLVGYRLVLDCLQRDYIIQITGKLRKAYFVGLPAFGGQAGLGILILRFPLSAKVTIHIGL